MKSKVPGEPARAIRHAHAQEKGSGPPGISGIIPSVKSSKSRARVVAKTGSPEATTATTPPVPAVLFADVSGWTDLTSRIGDQGALDLRDSLFIPLKDIVRKNGGWVVKTMGDGLMCKFDSPQDAALAACEMQRHAELVNRDAEEPLPLHIGIHAGQVVVKDDDIEGNTVNIAARVTAVSKPERILMTRVASERLNDDMSGLLRTWRSEVLKGKEETFDLFELNWREAGGPGTIISRLIGERTSAFKRLTLRCQGKVCVLEPGGKPLTFGRSRHNGLVIDDPLTYVSGSHGRIEIRGGAMLLTDNSRNGIFIAFGAGQYFLVDKMVVLRGSGRMSLGRSPEDPDAVLAEFELE
jgi:class 3 adenylate cyclase